MAENKVSVEITIEEKEALKALKNLSKGVESFSKDTADTVKKSDQAFSSFKGNLAALATSGAIKAIGAGLANLAIGSFEAAAATEKIKTQLEVLTGSQEKAANLYAELTAYSAGTPFQLQGISEAAAQLVSFGFEANTVNERIQKIGEVAAGSSSDLKEVALIYGQVSAAGKLTGERLLQFQERAIPIGPALAKSLGVAESKVKDLVSSGVVGFDEFETAFNSLSEAGGIFEGAVGKQAKTLNGAISTLKDNFFLLQSEIGSAFSPSLINGATVITESLQELTKVLVDNKDTLTAGIGFIADYIGVYSRMAGSLAEIETPLQTIDKQIASFIDKQQAAAKGAEEATKSLGGFLGIFDKDANFTIKQAGINIEVLEGKIKSLLEQRKKIASESTPDKSGEEDPRLKRIRLANEQILAERLSFQSQLDTLNADQRAKEEELTIADIDLGSEQRIEALNRLQVFNDSKADIELKSALEKNKGIFDLESRSLADQAAFAKNEIAITQNRSKTKQQIRALEIRDEQAFFASAISLSNNKNKELAAIGKAAGILQIAIATPPAIASSFNFGSRIGGPVLGGIFAGIAATAQAAQAAQMASFATGGVVGGFSGATLGNDDTTVNARNGEMFLNASQQRTLFDLANSKGGGSNNSGLAESISELANRPIVIEIDSREIAVAMREQQKEGFTA